MGVFSGITIAMLHLDHPPIIEAIVEINCDMPPSVDLLSVEESARQMFRDRYPKARRQFVESHQFSVEPSEASTRPPIGALQFFAEDERQLVQVRSEGYSFNRLAPYSTLDAYLPEIERTWDLFNRLTHPLQIRRIALRYINRLLLPTDEAGRLELNDFLRISPRMPKEESLMLTAFLNQHTAVDLSTGNEVNITLASRPIERRTAPMILDIGTANGETRVPNDWPGIRQVIGSLRQLKNDIFEKALTEQCLNLYRAR